MAYECLSKIEGAVDYFVSSSNHRALSEIELNYCFIANKHGDSISLSLELQQREDIIAAVQSLSQVLTGDVPQIVYVLVDA